MSPLIHVVLWQVVDELVKLACVFLCKLRKKFDFSWHDPPLNLAVGTIPIRRSCDPLAPSMRKFLTDDMTAVPITRAILSGERRTVELATDESLQPRLVDASPFWCRPKGTGI